MLVEASHSQILSEKISALRERILTDPIGVLDPPDQHHQFASLVNHGRKLDMDKIGTSTDFFGNGLMFTRSGLTKRIEVENPRFY